MRSSVERFPSVMEQSERTTRWRELADEILHTPVSRGELMALAAIASRVHTHSLIRACQMPETDPRDHELLTPEEIVTELKVSRWSVCEAIRRGELVPWRPHPKATRGLKVPRGVAKVWARGR